MFERFTAEARQVVVLAQDESRALKHGYIGVEHLLLALLRIGESAALLPELAHEIVQAEVVRRLGEGEHTTATGQIPFTPQAKKALELSLRSALDLGDNYISPTHVLLGVARTEEGGDVLAGLDVDTDVLRTRAGSSPRRPGALPTPLRRWEYRIEDFVELDADWLSSIGREGWELAAVLGSQAIFKRRAA